MGGNCTRSGPARNRLTSRHVITARNQDFDDGGNPPAAWTAFRQQVKAYDAVLFVTPEYNRSVPAPLKNALDVGSRS